MSPKRTAIISPGTRSIESISTSLPFLHALLFKARVFLRASNADSALASSMKPITALTINRPTRIPKSAQLPTTAEIMAAISIRIEIAPPKYPRNLSQGFCLFQEFLAIRAGSYRFDQTFQLDASPPRRKGLRE